MSICRAALVWVLCSLWAASAAAQELTPRTYWPAPRGTKVAVAGYAYSYGGTFFDPSVPLYGVDSQINTTVLAYVQTLSLWERTANVLVELPFSWGTTQGLLGKDQVRSDFSGIGDLGVTLTVNLLGAPSLTVSDFQALRADPHPILGASLKVVAPTGRYDSEKLINVGLNRWAARAQLGLIIPLKPLWLLELAAGTWFFGDDDDFLPGKREQSPVFAAQANIVKRFRPGFWASLDFTFFAGGRQTIGGDRLGDVQQNLKIGGTVVLPFRGRHAIKLGYANGVVTKFGTDFNQVLVTYQLLLR